MDIRFKGNENHYDTKNLFQLSKPSPVHLQTYKKLTIQQQHLYIMLVQEMSMHMVHKQTDTTSHDSHPTVTN